MAAAANAIVTLLAIMLKMAVAITLSQSEQLVIYAGAMSFLFDHFVSCHMCI